MTRKIFTYEEAVSLLPEVQRITTAAVESLDAIESEEEGPEQERIVRDWARAVLEMGIEVKGLWLVDFDSGAGYYCWRHPEPALEHFHGYDEGFGGRVKLN